MALPQFAEQRLSLLVCCKCGVEFAMPAAWSDSLRESHAIFYCPAGHAQHYAGETEAERLRKEAEQLRRRLEFAKNEAAAERDRTARQRRRVSAAKGRVTRLKNRVARGQCPCCGRAFADLREHMSARHPNYAEKET